jgi:hypothetical protein
MTTDTLTPPKTVKAKSAVSGKATATKVSTAQKPGMSRATGTPTVSEDIRRGMIAEAAYYRALKRNFVGGSEQEDWLLAEQEVDQQLASRTTH